MSASKSLHVAAPAPQPATARERLIVALDFPDSRQALGLVDRLEGSCQWYKVGLELYLASGNSIVETLISRGFSVFLDLKLHDIPNTVAGGVRSVSALGASMLTLHAAGGPGMLRAAADAAASLPNAPELLAVTVLTSMDAPQLAAIGIAASPAAQVLTLGKMARESGIRGFVCSPEEVGAMHGTLGPEAILVIPGIRPTGASIDDQKRIATPASAIRDGASYLVVGRPITQAADPGAAARAILAEIDAAL